LGFFFNHSGLFAAKYYKRKQEHLLAKRPKLSNNCL
jgi:hypothetical protein